jgi:uncharacterized protein DUF3306
MVAEENFLRRWSRRKHENVEQQPRSEPAAEPARPANATAPAADTGQRAVAGAASAPQRQPELPSVDSLKGLASDYKEFLDPAVDESLRRSALKKLFHDPHFNVMDGLDVYIDDYSKPDPIPESMLKDLLSRHFTFPDPAQPPAESEGEARLAEGPAADAASPAPEPAEPAPAAETAPPAAAPEEPKR